MATASKKQSSDVQSVVRACEILKFLEGCTQESGLDQVCRNTQIPRPTAYRLLTTLVRCGVVERLAKNSYRSVHTARPKRPRVGYASQTEEFSFSRLVAESISSMAYRAGVDLLVLDNHCSPKAALRNANIFVREHLDLVIEFQTSHQSASLVASRILEAGIPLIAIEVPHPGATYYGADNYKAGLLGGRALGKAALSEWGGSSG